LLDPTFQILSYLQAQIKRDNLSRGETLGVKLENLVYNFKFCICGLIHLSTL
jgi:hypothetical protein